MRCYSNTCFYLRLFYIICIDRTIMYFAGDPHLNMLYYWTNCYYFTNVNDGMTSSDNGHTPYYPHLKPYPNHNP